MKATSSASKSHSALVFQDIQVTMVTRDLLYMIIVLLVSATAFTYGITERSKEMLPTPKDTNIKDLSSEGSSGTSVGYLSPGIQTGGPVGQLGLGPYSVALLGSNPLLTALLLNSILSNPALGLGYGGIPLKQPVYNSQLYGRDPVIALLLRQYGKYLPYGLGRYGLYGYSAPNTVQDNRPFGTFKYEYRL